MSKHCGCKHGGGGYALRTNTCLNTVVVNIAVEEAKPSEPTHVLTLWL